MYMSVYPFIGGIKHDFVESDIQNLQTDNITINLKQIATLYKFFYLKNNTITSPQESTFLSFECA